MASSTAARADREKEAAAHLVSSNPEPEILIAGGGIGGLATALALARHGIASHVFERRDRFEEDGAGIQIGPNGTRILETIGVAEDLKPYVARPHGLRIRDGTSGRNITRLPLGAWIEDCHGAPYWTLHRKDLHAVLAKHALNNPHISVTMGVGIVACEQDKQRVIAKSGDGMSWQGSVLIAADGLHSTIRNAVVSGVKIMPSGRNAFRTVVPADNIRMPGARSETFIWLCPNAHVVHYPVRAGHEVALIAVLAECEATDGWNTPVSPKWMATQATAFPEPLRALCANAESWRKWTLSAAPLFPHMARDRIALLGDAAHPTLPFLAQGAVMALEDAVTLAACVARTREPAREALEEYERMRLARTRAIVQASERNGQIYHMAGPMARMRNSILSLVPPHRLLATYDWIYGWRAGEPS